MRRGGLPVWETLAYWVAGASSGLRLCLPLGGKTVLPDSKGFRRELVRMEVGRMSRGHGWSLLNGQREGLQDDVHFC